MNKLVSIRRKISRHPIIKPISERWLRSNLHPASRSWGTDRGLPIDRYYLNHFLQNHRADMVRNILEIGDDLYSRELANDEATINVLDHVERSKVNIVADLANAPQIESDSFDCLLILQTLMLIHDINAAIDTLYRITKPGGVVIASVNFIAPNCDHECQKWWQWNITPKAAHQLFSSRFGVDNVEVVPYGNYYAASAFLGGLSVPDINVGKLWPHENGYEVITGIRAVK